MNCDNYPLVCFLLKNLAYDVIRGFVLMIPFAFLFRNAFGLLKKSREVVGFAAAGTIALALLLFANSSQPSLRGKINEIIVLSSDAIQPPTPFQPAIGLILMISLANTGEPSAVSNYRVIATTPDGQEYIAKAISIPDSITGIVGNYKFTLNADQALYTKTITPIPKGGIVPGVLFFVFPDLQNGIIDQVGTNICLNYDDVTSYTYTTCYRRNGKLEALAIVPGINMNVESSHGQP